MRPKQWSAWQSKGMMDRSATVGGPAQSALVGAFGVHGQETAGFETPSVWPHRGECRGTATRDPRGSCPSTYPFRQPSQRIDPVSDIVREGEDPRAHMKSPLMRESLVSKRVAKQTMAETEWKILPDVNVLYLGGQAIVDRGKSAVMPLLDEIVKARRQHKLILGVGSGARIRHTYHIALDVGIPTGGLAMVAGGVDEQNTTMIQCLLAQHKGIVLSKDHMLHLPLWLESGMIPILNGMPPYHFWEPPAGRMRVPAHGTDIGIYLVSEVLGARSMIFIKDEDGIYTDDPKKNPDAEFIPKIGVQELIDRNLPDLPIEPHLLTAMLNARHTRQIQIINGLKPELLPQALAGEHVGTIVSVDD